MRPQNDPTDPEPPPDCSSRDTSQDRPSLAQDWITLWQSELAALIADRETHESWQALLALWAGAAGAMLRAMPNGAPDVAPRAARAAAAKRAAAAAAAPDVRDAEIDRLHRLVRELERRLAEIERRADQPRPDRRVPGRGTRKR